MSGLTAEPANHGIEFSHGLGVDFCFGAVQPPAGLFQTLETVLGEKLRLNCREHSVGVGRFKHQIFLELSQRLKAVVLQRRIGFIDGSAWVLDHEFLKQADARPCLDLLCPGCDAGPDQARRRAPWPQTVEDRAILDRQGVVRNVANHPRGAR